MNDLPENVDRLTQGLRTMEQHIATLEQRLEESESRLEKTGLRLAGTESRLDRAESRIVALEHPLAAGSPHPTPNSESAFVAAAVAIEPPPAGSLFPVLGKAMLGIAGAYVLRAIEETSALPRVIVAVAGIVYAFLWLVWAARARGGPGFASSIYACTSALILAPMLWELTLRFNILPPAVAAVVICGFALAAFALAAFTPRDLRPVVRVACVAAAALALALAIASHDFLPFVAVLLTLGAVCEFVPGCDRLLEVRILVALAADAAVWILIYIYFAGQSAHDGYPALGHGALLVPGIGVFLLYAASVGVRTVLRVLPVTAFEIVQTIVAFLLAAVSLADFDQPMGTVILGVGCLVFSAACYAVVFTIFARASDQRNSAVFAAWAAALLLSGNILCLPALISFVLPGGAALAAVGLGRRKHRAVFEYYGMAFLLAAVAASGLLNFLVNALVGTPVGSPAVGVWLTAVCAMLCYVLAGHGEDEPWVARALHLGFAALAAGAVAALLVATLVAMTALRVVPGAHHLALIRTVALCVAALVLVFGGARWRRRELTRLGYAAIALVAIKLITEDLRHGHLAYIAASIFLVAFTLLAAPRVARTRQRA